jgi:two-component system NarL family sensor kinase
LTEGDAGGPPVERRRGERRREDRERIRLFEQLIAAEQDERRRLALFLHDSAVQSLSGIALMLDAVAHAIDEGRFDSAKEVLRAALERQRETIQSLRDLSFNLEPVVLRDLGFGPAVRALVDRLALHESLEINLHVAAGEELAERAQVALYQLIREALAQAIGRNPTRLSIGIASLEDGGVRLTVADDGHLERRRGTAEAFEERARPLSGRVNVDPTEQGTTVTVELPAYTVRG